MTKSVISKSYTLQRWSDGSLRSAPEGPNFPRTALIAIGGDQGYGSATAYLTQVTGHQIGSNGFFPESAFVNPVQWIGRFDLAILGGNWENWTTSGGRDRADLVEAIKQIQLPVSLSSKVYLYHVFERAHQTLSANPYPTWNATVSSESWYLYNAAAQGGAPIVTSDDATQNVVNYAVAYPGAVGGTAAGVNFTPNRLTAPDGTVEGPTSYFADYIAMLTYSRQSGYSGSASGVIAPSLLTDSRFSSFPARMKAPNLDGIYTDNNFAAPRTAGFYDLAHNAGVNDFVAPTGSYLVRGTRHVHTRFQHQLSVAYPGRVYNTICNFASWAPSFASGLTNFNAMSAAFAGTDNGGVLEGFIGKSFGPEATFGWDVARQYYFAMLDYCLTPKHVMVDVAATITDFQTARYGICTALLGDGYIGVEPNAGYDYSQVIWPDELGGNPGTNIALHWLGNRVGIRPSVAYINGVWAAEFDNGIALVNPKGNGSQTVTAAQLLAFGSLAFFQGVQDATLNSGASFSSITLAASDGVLLMKT